jgi:hypothetical protein
LAGNFLQEKNTFFQGGFDSMMAQSVQQGIFHCRSGIFDEKLS